MGKFNIKKVNMIIFTVVMAIGVYGCSMKQTDSSKVETVLTIKEAYSSAIIKQYGSYEAFKMSILDNLNVIRAQNGKH